MKLSDVANYAAKYVGLVGQSYGHGPEIDKWLALVYEPPGNSWCAAFVVGMFREAFGERQPVPRVAGALKLWGRSPREWRSREPSPGMIYVVDHGRGQGHVGIVEAVDADAAGGTQVTEISGNTNPVGSRTGNAVERHWWSLESARNGMPVHGGTLVGFLAPVISQNA